MDASGPDLDVQFVYLTRIELLNIVVQMIRLMRQRALRVELARRCPQPAMRQGGVRIIRSRKRYLFEVRRKQSQDDKDVGIVRRGGDEQLGGRRDRQRVESLRSPLH